jgi:hypothetical protein
MFSGRATEQFETEHGPISETKEGMDTFLKMCISYFI